MKSAKPHPPDVAYFVESLTMTCIFAEIQQRKPGREPKTLLSSSEGIRFQCNATMIAPSGNGSFLFAIGLDRYIVAQLGAQLVEIAFFVGHRDQIPVAVSRRDRYSVDRRGSTGEAFSRAFPDAGVLEARRPASDATATIKKTSVS